MQYQVPYYPFLSSEPLAYWSQIITHRVSRPLKNYPRISHPVYIKVSCLGPRFREVWDISSRAQYCYQQSPGLILDSASPSFSRTQLCITVLAMMQNWESCGPSVSAFILSIILLILWNSYHINIVSSHRGVLPSFLDSRIVIIS